MSKRDRRATSTGRSVLQGRLPQRRQQDPIPVAGLVSGAQLSDADRAEQAEEALRRIVCVLESGEDLDTHDLAAIAIACDVLDIEVLSEM